MAGIGFKAAVALSSLTGALLAVPGTAGAATLSGSQGTLTYTAAPGQANSVDFAQQGADAVRVFALDGDPIAASGTCTEDLADPGRYDCTGIARVVADGGDLADQLLHRRRRHRAGQGRQEDRRQARDRAEVRLQLPAEDEVPRRRAFGRRRVLTFTARYHGNTVMAAKTSRRVKARIR